MFDHPTDQNERRKELCTFLVRCWSDPGDDIFVTVKSFSVYEAAQDARIEHPEYDNYDPVCFLQNVLDGLDGLDVLDGRDPFRQPRSKGAPTLPCAILAGASPKETCTNQGRQPSAQSREQHQAADDQGIASLAGWRYTDRIGQKAADDAANRSDDRGDQLSPSAEPRIEPRE